MNLEDFKSFRRVLKPSEVGSIPTHSRHRLGGILLVALLLAGSAAAVRAEDGPGAAGPSAFQRALRSVVFPAWGQVTNGKTKKAMVLFGVQTYIYTRMIRESREAGEADRRARSATDPDVIAAAEASSRNHYDRRRDLFFWAIVAGFYGAMDAYIDTYLGEFDRELEDGRELFAGVGPDGTSVELGLRF